MYKAKFALSLAVTLLLAPSSSFGGLSRAQQFDEASNGFDNYDDELAFDQINDYGDFNQPGEELEQITYMDGGASVDSFNDVDEMNGDQHEFLTEVGVVSKVWKAAKKGPGGG